MLLHNLFGRGKKMSKTITLNNNNNNKNKSTQNGKQFPANI